METLSPPPLNNPRSNFLGKVRELPRCLRSILDILGSRKLKVFQPLSNLTVSDETGMFERKISSFFRTKEESLVGCQLHESSIPTGDVVCSVLLGKIRKKYLVASAPQREERVNTKTNRSA
eukprot:CAMPEP_0201474844 /NCGR_PEP_ID=MMETSP0151_2-20130828/305_1 /ASSEMBLY_ACC=CAM_ASM_000257 /TAXON_ID=200890 /ORGANISM="Paramoeba atlantica, Strain 621/1 / CCAP 1560/9" /LENGTH=120 /DNA_ID=CAMNT_0047854755 /DNA_START=279 /DNA_END=641 /DNA_ORIENTATION=+